MLAKATHDWSKVVTWGSHSNTVPINQMPTTYKVFKFTITKRIENYCTV